MKFKSNVIIDGFALAKLFKVELAANQSVNAGEAAWNAIDGTFDLGLLNGVKLQTGQEILFYGKATENIANGDAIMFAGVQGDHILMAKASPSTINSNPEYFMGIATQSFVTNQFGYVTAFGNVRTLNTSSYPLGAILYFNSSSTSSGVLTTTEQVAPNAKIIVAAVVKVHATEGILAVRPHTMPKLNGLQDVNTTQTKSSLVDADSFLIQDTANSNVWKRFTWQNLKSNLKTYFDTLYQAILVSGVNIKTINGIPLLGSGNITISGGGSTPNLQQVTDAGNSTNNPIYFNGNVPLYGQYNSFFAGAEQRPDGQGWLYSAEETNLGVYDSSIGVFVSSIYSRRNIIVPNNFYEYILAVAGGTYWGISFDIVINFGAEGVYLHGKGTAIFNPFNQTVRYKLEWDGALSDPEYYGYEKVRIEFVSDPSGYFYLMAVNDMNDSYTVNITAKVL